MTPEKFSKNDAFGTINLARLIDQLLDSGDPEIYRKVTLAVDRIVIDVVLRQTKGNQVQASELLGMSRTTLRNKLRSLGLAVEKQLSSEWLR
jgi:two-component system nitrogen regulation response regulator GlnG